MALNKIQAKVLEALAKSSLNNKFYWTGGTLLAEKYLQHRESQDIDLFSDNSFSYQEILPLVHQIQKETKLKEIEEKKIFSRFEFFIHNGEKLRFEFVHYDFPKIKSRKKWQGVLIDSLEDLAANKVMSVLDRKEPKDVIDLYFIILKKRYTLEKLLKLACKKFKLKIVLSTFLGEIITGSRTISEIKALLSGTKKEQEEIVNQIKEYFQRKNADFIKEQLE